MIAVRSPIARPPVLVHTMAGLGDTIYQRPLIHELARRGTVYVRTAWPELYEDLPVELVADPTRLRTQARNVAAQPAQRFVEAPVGMRPLLPHYGKQLVRSDILSVLAAQLRVPIRAAFFDLPPLEEPLPFHVQRPIALVRPVTVRSEWRNEARNPRPEYVAEAVDLLRERFHVVSVADVAHDAEWFLDAPPVTDHAFHHGELTVRQLVTLVRRAAVIVGGIGWIAPAAVAAKRPLILIAGGNGGHNAPQRIFHVGLDTSRVEWILPQKYCRCTSMRHACDKTIPHFGYRFRQALERVAA